MGMPDFRRTGGKVGLKLEKLSFSRKIRGGGQLFQFRPGRIEGLFYTFLTEITLPFL